MSKDDSAIEELRSEIRYIEVLLGAGEARLKPDTPRDAQCTLELLGDILQQKLKHLEKLLARHYANCA